MNHRSLKEVIDRLEAAQAKARAIAENRTDPYDWLSAYSRLDIHVDFALYDLRALMTYSEFKPLPWQQDLGDAA